MIAGSQVVAATGQAVSVEVKLPQGLLAEDKFDQLLAQYAPQIANEARDYWITLAGQTLRTSRDQYIEGIQLEHVNGQGFVLSLSGDLAVAVELGSGAYNNPANNSDKPVIVMNTDKEVVNPMFPVYSNPTFRKPGNLAPHPGWVARNLAENVMEYITDELIPKYVQKIVEEL